MSLNESVLGKEYLEYCNLKEIALNTKTLDLSNITWFFPTFLLPLGIFIKEHKEIHVIPPIDIEVSRYFNIMMNHKIDSDKKSYIPIVEIVPNVKLIYKNLELLLSNIHKENQIAFAYFIGELIDNIYEHSSYSKAYIMAQRYKQKKITEIGIIDNGISISGSYKAHGFNFSDIQALKEAINGLSTKSDDRGYGLRTSLKLLTRGLEAECLIISRGASLIANKNNTIFFEMEENNNFTGTLISTRFLSNIREVNIYEYIEE
ncbi:hypothetical protein LCGC14_0957240 [marine sediment metagenome]|uniref:Uncharacterized protein n=1 Tax=marine sediment metagenome TaxID=412755 RepID=A0A0F9QYW7_9ZZZZ